MEQVFFWMAVAGAVLVMLQFAAYLLGLELEVFNDVPDGPDAGGTEGLLFRSVLAWGVALAVAGVTGWVLLRTAASAAWPLLATVALALGAGAVSLVAVAAGLRAFYRLGEEDVTPTSVGAVGYAAEVILPIPAALAGEGRVQVNTGAQILEMPAHTRDATPLDVGQRVYVVAADPHGGPLEVARERPARAT